MRRRYLDRATLVSLFVAALFLILPLVASASNDGAAAGLIGGVFGLFCGLIGLAITVAITVYMYRDASARGENGILWGLIGFFLGLVGLIIWLIVRQNKPKIA